MTTRLERGLGRAGEHLQHDGLSRRVPLLLVFGSLVVMASCLDGRSSSLDTTESAEPSTMGAYVEGRLTAVFPAHAPRILAASQAFVAHPEGFVREPREGMGGFQTAGANLDLALPLRGEQRITLRVGTDFAIGVREVGAAGAGALAGGAVAYPRVGGTSLWHTTAEGVEEWLHLAAGVARGGEPVASWEVDGATLHQAEEVVEVLDAQGIPRLRVTAPEAVAVGGRALQAKLAVRGAVLELWVDAGGDEVLVDPGWTVVAPMETARVGHTATLLNNGKVLVTGGEGLISLTSITSAELYDSVNDTWLAAAPMATKISALKT
jgi:hypothetical protein